MDDGVRAEAVSSLSDGAGRACCLGFTGFTPNKRQDVHVQYSSAGWSFLNDVHPADTVLVCSHAVNVLNNLPVPCLDMLIHVPVQGGQEKYGGKNMDAIQKLLEFMEKRIDKVRTSAAEATAAAELLFIRAAPGLTELPESLAGVFGRAAFLSVSGVKGGVCSQGSNYKEGLTPVLSMLTEGSRCHREIRRYIKAQVGGRHRSVDHSPILNRRAWDLSHPPANRLRLQVLPPLKDVKIRPEVGSMLRNKLVRLMTHVDMGVKQTAAEFLFVLCKESGEQDDGLAPRSPGSPAPF